MNFNSEVSNLPTSSTSASVNRSNMNDCLVYDHKVDILFSGQSGHDLLPLLLTDTSRSSIDYLADLSPSYTLGDQSSIVFRTVEPSTDHFENQSSLHPVNDQNSLPVFWTATAPPTLDRLSVPITESAGENETVSLFNAFEGAGQGKIILETGCYMIEQCNDKPSYVCVMRHDKKQICGRTFQQFSVFEKHKRDHLKKETLSLRDLKTEV